MFYSRTNVDRFVGVSKTERKSGSDGDEVITGGAKQQPRQGCWLGNNHIILCTPSSSPIHIPLSGWTNVM